MHTGYLPWFFQHDRQMYFFYAAVMVPFFVMMVSLVLGEISSQVLRIPTRAVIRRTICLYLTLVIVGLIFNLRSLRHAHHAGRMEHAALVAVPGGDPPRPLAHLT